MGADPLVVVQLLFFIGRVSVKSIYFEHLVTSANHHRAAVQPGGKPLRIAPNFVVVVQLLFLSRPRAFSSISTTMPSLGLLAALCAAIWPG
ncbi:MAG: hypothetical protein ACK55I_21830 [bacterium]